MSSTGKVANIQADLQAFSTAVYLFQQSVADKMKLHPTDFHAIHLLDRYGPMPAGKLAARLGLTSGATTAAIDRLVSLGYAERIAGSTDRRSIAIGLRANGMQKMRREYKQVAKQVQVVVGQFSDAELKIISRFLHLLITT